MADISTQLQQQVKDAYAQQRGLHIVGGKSKTFYGEPIFGESLHLAPHHGVVNYEPSELIITSRAGTSLEEIERTLYQHGQMLGFEPPYFGASATIGGTIACGFSGPRRASTGSARDFVLGTRIINGRGEILRFGGEVMKNVAGYDVARLMAGARGTLGVLLEISLKVLPKPEIEITLTQESNGANAIALMNRWAGLSLPISATAYHDGKLSIRLSGTKSSVANAQQKIGGELLNSNSIWQDIREQRHVFFNTNALWRISVPSAVPELALRGQWLYEWNGALRWYIGNETPAAIRAAASAIGGHATMFRGSIGDSVFQPLPEELLTLNQAVHKAFDPADILNPTRNSA